MRDPKDSPVHLTPSQRRHLELSLGHILLEMEEAGHWLERWPLPREAQDQTRNALKDLGARVIAVAEELGLSPTGLRPDPRRKIESLASHWWTTVLDCRSQVLRGYGEVDADTARRLDPLVDDLASSLMGLLTFGGEEKEEEGRV